MPHVAHFSINADNLDRARKFYGNTFGWKFDPWGPPGFYRIHTGERAPGEMLGSMQGRRELIPGQRMIGYECTISVPSISDTIRSIEQNGGKLVMQKTVIAGVGSLVFFEDTEGNVAGAMQYEKPAK